jgi:hypothetical protein
MIVYVVTTLVAKAVSNGKMADRCLAADSAKSRDTPGLATTHDYDTRTHTRTHTRTGRQQ